MNTVLKDFIKKVLKFNLYAFALLVIVECTAIVCEYIFDKPNREAFEKNDHTVIKDSLTENIPMTLGISFDNRLRVDSIYVNDGKLAIPVTMLIWSGNEPQYPTSDVISCSMPMDSDYLMEVIKLLHLPSNILQQNNAIDIIFGAYKEYLFNPYVNVVLGKEICVSNQKSNSHIRSMIVNETGRIISVRTLNNLSFDIPCDNKNYQSFCYSDPDSLINAARGYEWYYDFKLRRSVIAGWFRSYGNGASILRSQMLDIKESLLKDTFYVGEVRNCPSDLFNSPTTIPDIDEPTQFEVDIHPWEVIQVLALVGFVGVVFFSLLLILFRLC